MEEQKEMEIPVFSVWKNNAILKNIFLINAPPPSVNQQENDEICKTHQEFEETLLVGRHPDCHIRLEHPSISRFHLRIHSIPSSKHLFLTDLSSVHGTWVSGKRIEANIRTRMNESDSLRIGGSSRVYKLHWIPLSQAYDVSNPFVPPLDFVLPQEDEDEEEIIKDDSVSKGLEFGGVVCDDDKLVVDQVAPKEDAVMKVENEFVVELDDPDMEGLMSLFLDDKPEVFVEREETPPNPPTQDLESEFIVNENVQPLDSVLEGLVPLFMGENWEWVGQEGSSYMACPTEEEDVDEEYPHSVQHEEDVGGSVDAVLEGSDTLYSDENAQQLVQKEILSAPEDEDDEEEDVDEDEEYPHSVQHEDLGGSVDAVLEGSDTLYSNENAQQLVQKEILSVPEDEDDEEEDVDEDEDYPHSVQHEDVGGSVDAVLEGSDTLYSNENAQQLVQKEILSAPSVPEEHMALHMSSPVLDNNTAKGSRSGSKFVSELIQNENKIPQQEENIQDGLWNFWCGSLVAPTSSLATKRVLLSTENNHFDVEKKFPENESEPKLVLSEREHLESVNVYQNSSVKDHNGSKLWSFWTGNMGVESSVCSSLSDASFLSEFENKSLRNGFESPPLSSIKRPFGGSPLITSDQKSASNLWSRRGKLQSAPHISTSRSERKKMISEQKDVKHEPISRALFHEVESQEEEEVFTPDKENFTPNTHRSMRKLAMLKEMKNSSSGKSPVLKMIGSPKVYYEDSMSPSSDKENYSPRTFLKKKTAHRASVNQAKSVPLKEKKGERMPFQSLLADSPQNSKSKICIPSAAEVPLKTIIPDIYSGEKTRNWSMLVDTTTLLNKESRKALQLLEGLKGTQLIIPKIVINDLACLKRQTSFFRRNTEVSSALEWIEDCMVNTQWWIHVQNSTEEGRPVAPTPPASPYSQVSCGTTGSFAYSALEFRSELLSPATEDHVLDYALSFRRNKNDGQLVLLSNDVTLKIKAMAEGIICETAEEFRESLVNPFSERFLWTDSSPRGQTWSYSDDFVLREKFYPSSLKMTPKAMENVKGLKLILLHNSQYFERMTAIY